MSRPTPNEDSADRPARARSSRRRTAAMLLLGVLAVAGAAFAIVWLPPNDDVETAVETTVLEYELAREAAWPKGATLGLPLSPADEDALAGTLRTRVERHAAGAALEDFDADGVAQAFSDAAALDLVHAVTRWTGEVVYFDFVRHTLPNGVIVRVGVHKAHRVGRVNAVDQRVFANRWVGDKSADINEYTLRQVDGAWRVVKVGAWGTCSPDGEGVVEGRPPD